MNEFPANDMPSSEQEGREVNIDLMQIAGLLWSRKFIILAVMAVAAALAFVKVTFFTADVYTAEGVLYVSNRTELTQTAETDMVYGSNIDTSRMMSETYMEILSTRAFFTDVSKAMGGVYTWDQIRAMMSIAVVNETELLKITVRSGSAEDAYLVANTIINQATQKLGGIFDGGEIKIVEDAVYPEVPNDKGLSRVMLIAIFIGFILSCGVIIVLNFFDDTIHRSEDITRRYNIPVLGELPD